jgi:hypothetical protein
LASQRFDLAGTIRNARAQAVPACHQIFEDAQHAQREHTGCVPGNSARKERSPSRTAIPRSNMKARI